MLHHDRPPRDAVGWLTPILYCTRWESAPSREERCQLEISSGGQTPRKRHLPAEKGVAMDAALRAAYDTQIELVDLAEKPRCDGRLPAKLHRHDHMHKIVTADWPDNTGA
jgi:hypothetical protein